jgi:hypothetical protein
MVAIYYVPIVESSIHIVFWGQPFLQPKKYEHVNLGAIF